jgi:uncharacterized protein YndB with AHSA1/START domain
MNTTRVDTKLDLVLKRELAVPVSLVWQGLTKPELLKQWFCPKPWSLSDCRLDLRPGGEFYTVMQDPEGKQYPNTGCFLEVVHEKRLTWTSTPDQMKAHEEMGFNEGWGATLTQLEELLKQKK